MASPQFRRNYVHNCSCTRCRRHQHFSIPLLSFSSFLPIDIRENEIEKINKKCACAIFSCRSMIGQQSLMRATSTGCIYSVLANLISKLNKTDNELSKGTRLLMMPLPHGPLRSRPAISTPNQPYPISEFRKRRSARPESRGVVRGVPIQWLDVEHAQGKVDIRGRDGGAWKAGTRPARRWGRSARGTGVRRSSLLATARIGIDTCTK